MIHGIEYETRDDIVLNREISIPSAVHGYSIAIQYMKEWFLDKFSSDYFKTVHVNGKHVLADYRRFNPDKKIKQIIKPAVSITPSLNVDYNRDNLDLLLSGANIWTRRSSYYKDSFFVDTDNNVYLGMQMKQIEMPFTFHIRVSSRAAQLDMVDYLRVYCRIGSTQSEYIDMDCHIPNDIMIAIAMDLGFTIIEDEMNRKKVRDVVSFLKYLNSHSQLPFMYKLRTINGNHEYFLRLRRCYVHISCLDGISIDDGERQGMLDNNFHVDFTATLKFPVPSIFSYYSKTQHKIMGKEPDSIYGIYNLVDIEPPEKNRNGWEQYLSTEWIDDSKKLSTIDFRELLEQEDLQQVINHQIQIGLSPAIFMDVKIYNGQHELDIRIDWENYSIIIDQEVPDEISYITIYIDKEYFNTALLNITNSEGNRVQTNEQLNV